MTSTIRDQQISQQRSEIEKTEKIIRSTTSDLILQKLREMRQQMTDLNQRVQKLETENIISSNSSSSASSVVESLISLDLINQSR